MNIISLLVIILIVLLLSLALIILIKKIKKNEEVEIIQDEEEKKHVYDLRLIDLPIIFDSFNNNKLRVVSKDLYKVFKILDYKKNKDEYAKNSWHSWQVSFLIAMYKRDLELFLPDYENTFHENIINDSLENIQFLMKTILKKYTSSVNVNHSRDTLSKELIWSGQEVEVLMYYLCKYKNSKKDKS